MKIDVLKKTILGSILLFGSVVHPMGSILKKIAKVTYNPNEMNPTGINSGSALGDCSEFNWSSDLMNNAASSTNKVDYDYDTGMVNFPSDITQNLLRDNPCEQRQSVEQSIDTTYLYRAIDIDNPDSTQLLNDQEMRETHIRYLEKSDGNIQRIELERNDLDCSLNQHTGIMDYGRYLDLDRGAKLRRLSFMNRVLRHYNEQKLVTDSAEATINNDFTTFLCTTKNSVAQINSQLHKREQMLISGKTAHGGRLHDFEKLVLKKEIEFIKHCRSLPGMKHVETIQNAPNLHQAMYAYSLVEGIPNVDPVVQQVAKSSLETYPGYAEYKQEQALAQQQEFKTLSVLEMAQKYNDKGTSPCDLNRGNFLQKGEPFYDFVQTTPTDVDAKTLRIFQEKVTADPKTDFQSYVQQLNETLNMLESQGFITGRTALFFARDFAKCSAQHVAYIANHPQEYAMEFVQAQIDLIDNLALLCGQPDVEFATPQEMQQWEMRVQEKVDSITQQFNQLCDAIPQMSREDWAQLSSRLFIDTLVLKGVGKGVGALRNLPKHVKSNPFFDKLHSGLEQALTRHPEMLTTDGLVIKAPQAIEETGVLKNAADKVRGTTKEVVKDATRIESVANMKKVFEKNDFGRILQKKSVKTKFIDAKTNSQIYEITEKLTEFGLKKGDQFYLDKFHGDHIEVFRNRKCVDVLNLDGSVNSVKVDKALKERRILLVK